MTTTSISELVEYLRWYARDIATRSNSDIAHPKFVEAADALEALTRSIPTAAPDDAAVERVDIEAANKALDIAFRGDTSSIDDDMARLFASHRQASGEAGSLALIAEMMSAHVDNWPNPKKFSTAISLINKVIAAAVQDGAKLRDFISKPPRHDFWQAGEVDCPKDIRSGNGELHTLRCKSCGQDNPRNHFCRASLDLEHNSERAKANLVKSGLTIPQGEKP